MTKFFLFLTLISTSVLYAGKNPVHPTIIISATAMQPQKMDDTIIIGSGTPGAISPIDVHRYAIAPILRYPIESMESLEDKKEDSKEKIS